MKSVRDLSVAPLASLILLGLSACFRDSVTEPPAPTPGAADTAFNVFANLGGTAVNNAADVYSGLSAPVLDTIRNVEADTLTPASKPYAYVDLDGGAMLPATGDTSAWDIAFRSTGVRVRGEFAVVVETPFDSVAWAPALSASGTVAAWYNYAGPPSHLITPKPGYVLVVKTSSGNFAKIEFLSYYKGAPASPDGLTDTSKHYTFRYVIQKGGSRALKAGVAPRTFYSLRTNSVVTDTAAGWDLGFSNLGILVNGSSRLVASNFDSLKTAPEADYAAGTAPAWYNYNPTTHLVSPKGDTTLVLKLHDGTYAKLQIRSYYKGAPAVPNPLGDTTRYYTFRYVLQANGSRDFTLDSPYAYFSLATGTTVSDTSAGWDIAFRTTNVITRNGGQVVNGTFDGIVLAPETGYVPGALPAWYTYNSQTHVVTPTLGKLIVLKTHDGKYAKVEILSYYQGNPATPTSESVSRHYTFRWFRQADGSTNLQ